MSLLWYLHTKPIRASSAAADLSSPRTREKERARTGLVWVPGAWPEVYFLTRLVVGTEAAVQNQGSHRLTEKHRGQGLRNRLSCDATVLTLTTCAASLTASGMRREGWGKRERESGLSQFRGIPVKVVSHPCRVYRDRSVLRYIRRLPVPTVEHPSMGDRTQGPVRPKGSLTAHKRHLQKLSHYQVDLESRRHKTKVTIVWLKLPRTKMIRYQTDISSQQRCQNAPLENVCC